MRSSSISSIAIVGLGLIGASLLQALRRAAQDAGMTIHFRGYDPAFDQKDVDRIGTLGLDCFETDKQRLYDSDIIILAAPVHTNIWLLDEIATFAAPGTLVTDVSSTKQAIDRRASRLGIRFLGMHPIAGKERHGYQESCDSLFRNKTVIFCGSQGILEAADAKAFMELVSLAGGNVSVMGPEEHDRAVACVSHLPQLLSTALINHCCNDIPVSGPGFATLTRLAASPWHIWKDIIETNREHIGEELRAFGNELIALADDVEHKRMETIRNRFDSANTLHELLNRRNSQ
ncbi:prephenate dehydrogenase/arogenate dehydrogenase family protein [Prosthecochloris sp. HL-130-GSB]|jgi:prephenate dehydrogenase|uniref:prephenate dehydrogenase n=1 Tax=Prosthecochloris sp. HL-130-GSB TaxID=1974213 RepID=UPI000A1C192B|nr:prephenate dehydrogenase/arogenate dehydrogenase family protein [Prosthecochloris sp. HL-130-GSB]ARM31666.1 prephenate dehydrogenase [Prosthecochloris sp. HL-130-GSB]MBO8093088.1 prephenate dehydrogenase/arogenate dehydrogenase family protein [Prosthecochloris sp.]